MDALCARTVTMQKRVSMELPTPDYDLGPNGPFEHKVDQQHMKPRDIRKNIPLEIKEISRDIQMRSKQDVQKRPEFLSKQHQIKVSALKKQEEKDRVESNELLQRLKSRSEQIEQVETEKNSESNELFQKLKSRSDLIDQEMERLEEEKAQVEKVQVEKVRETPPVKPKPKVPPPR